MYQSKENFVHQTEKLQPSNTQLISIHQSVLNNLKQAEKNGQQHIWQSALYDHNGIVKDKAKQKNELSQYLKPIKKHDHIVLITDMYCISACLDFIDLVKQYPDVLHLGQATDSDTAYTEIIELRKQSNSDRIYYRVPVKKWEKRLRDDNQPYIPDVIYKDDINDTKALRTWVLEQAAEHFNLTLAE